MARRLALITGGTSGIGLGVARALAGEHDLALSYAGNHERAAAARRELEACAPETRIRLFPGELRTYDDAATLVRAVEAEFGARPDVLVNSAGRLRDGLFIGSDFRDHEELVQQHLLVPMALAHVVVREMYKRRFGRIVGISSISARYARKGQCNYAAAKAGLEGFTRTLALEVAHRGVTVNAVAPGLIETPMTEPLLGRVAAREGGVARKVPQGGAGQPADVGSLVRFLCSDEARYITGAVHTVDGGRSLGDVDP